MKNLIAICDYCKGRKECPVSEKEKKRKVSCDDDLYDKYNRERNNKHENR